jgi:hypothetical protein
VENHDFQSISTHSAPAHSDAPELSLRLLRCPRCGQTNVLTLSRIAWHLVKHRLQVKSVPLVNQMLITQSEADEVVSVGKMVQAQREAGEADPVEEAERDVAAAGSNAATAEIHDPRTAG